MKRIFLTSMAFIIAMLAFAGKHNYSINGTVADGVAVGDTLYLMEMRGEAPVVINLAVVKDNAFLFHGEVKTPKLCSLVSKERNDYRNLATIFLEKGDIEVTIEKEGTSVMGTMLNNRLQEYNDSTRLAVDIYMLSYNKIMCGNLSPLAREEAEKSMTAALEMRKAFVVRFIEQNIKNPLAPFAIKQNFEILEPSFALSVIEQLPSSMRDDAIRMLQKNYKNIIATSPGKRFADVRLVTPENQTAYLSHYVGKDTPAILCFWSSSNKFSINELKRLQQFVASSDEDIELIAISIDTDGEAWKKAIADNHLPGIQLGDLKGWGSEAMTTYGVNMLPYIILFDADGKVLERGKNAGEYVMRSKK